MMKRRSFLKHTALITVVGSLLPTELVKAGVTADKQVTYALPHAVPQVRHGNYALSSIDLPLPSWVQMAQPNRLLANGVETSSNDLTTHRIQVGEHAVTYIQSEDLTRVSLGDVFIECANDQPYEQRIAAYGYTLTLLNSGAHKKSIVLPQGGVAIAYRGYSEVAHHPIQENEVAVLHGKEIDGALNAYTTLLVISNHQ